MTHPNPAREAATHEDTTMTINLQKPDITELKPRITVFGVGGGGCNAVNNMIESGLEGVEFVVANTDAQALSSSKASRLVQMGVDVTQGLGAGSQPQIGAAAADECMDEIRDHLSGTHMCFVTAGMGGGTGTGAAPVVAKAAREQGILTVGVVTKPFSFEGRRRMKIAEDGIVELQKNVDTLIVIPNQNLFRVANEKTTFAAAFSMADEVLYSGVACITDLMVKEGLINLDFADVRSVMHEMGRAMMGTGEASGEGRALAAAEAAISNPLLDETSMAGSKGLLISITGGFDMTLFEVDEAATRISEEVDQEANIIVGATFDENLEGTIRVSVVATGNDQAASQAEVDPQRIHAAAERLRQSAEARTAALSGIAAAEEAAPFEAAPAVAEPAPAIEAEIVRQPEVAAPAPMQAAVEAPVVDEADFARELDREMQHGSVPAETAPAIAQAAPRMPSVQDLPPVARQQVAHAAQPAPAEGSPVGGLFRRIASGFGGGGEEQAETARPQNRLATPAPAPAPVAAQPAAPAAPRSAPDSPYAPSRNAALDPHGRPAPRALSEEEQLDIPAFLRRNAG